VKKKWAVALAVVAVLVLGALAPLLPLRGLRHLSASEFADIAGRDPAPMFSVEWIGATSDRAYLETRVMNLLEQWHTVVYWTELADLPPEEVSKVTSGVNPWRVRKTAEGTGR
jgi:hypothetical protein